MKKAVLSVAVMAALAGCQTTNTIDIGTYSPVIDHYRVPDQAQYQLDLAQCRDIGRRAQLVYQEQRRKEQQQALGYAAVGALAGTVIGNQLDNSSGGRTRGALAGAAIGGSIGAEQVDYSRTIAKFGPTAVVDRCMVDRGYKILSVEGLGGG